MKLTLEHWLMILGALWLMYDSFVKHPDVYQGCRDNDRSAKCLTWGALP